jgi:signal transduction histidine kinase
MKNSIARRLMLYFALALGLFALVIGLVFTAFFRQNIVDRAKEELKAKAETIAAAVSGGTAAQMDTGRRFGMQGKARYALYLNFLTETGSADAWIVDEDHALLTGKATAKAYLYTDLTESADKAIEEAFKGNITFSEGFSQLLNTPTLTVASPIRSGDTVIAALLLHAPVKGIGDAAAQGLAILLYSTAAALALSAILSALLAAKLSKPLHKITGTALCLAEGNYESRTGIAQRDEIGRLASAVDTLSERLESARSRSEGLDKLRRDFVANISHELKTPVTVLRGSLEALCDGVIRDPDQIAQYHKQMLNESLALQRLVSDLLELSKLQNTDFSMDMAQINLMDALSDAVRSARQMAAGKEITIILDMDRPLFPYTGDYARLRQLFLIVLSNAVKFSPVGSNVEATVKGYSVTVTDHGPGIAAADLPYIFDRFYKARPQEEREGSGLGLAIARGIAQRHGAVIAAASQPGEGAVFTIDFQPVIQASHTI